MARRILNLLPRAASLSSADWRCLAIAVFELLLARIRFAAQPATRILNGLQEASPSSQGGAETEIDLSQLSWAIGAAAARVPWRSDCLLQAMAADRWLRRCGHRPDFYLGAQLPQPGCLQAHAWLYCDGVAVTGGSGGGFTALLQPRCASAAEE